MGRSDVGLMHDALGIGLPPRSRVLRRLIVSRPARTTSRRAASPRSNGSRRGRVAGKGRASPRSPSTSKPPECRIRWVTNMRAAADRGFGPEARVLNRDRPPRRGVMLTAPARSRARVHRGDSRGAEYAPPLPDAEAVGAARRGGERGCAPHGLSRNIRFAATVIRRLAGSEHRPKLVSRNGQQAREGRRSNAPCRRRGSELDLAITHPRASSPKR